MRTSMFRGVLSWLLIMVLPAASFAADSGAAMLYTNGAAWINGGTVPKSSAIFSGDLVQTRTDSVASIKATGTSVMVFSDSLVQFQGSAVKLEHGSLNVGTSRSMAAQIGELRVVPASGTSWTEFEVTDTDGAVKIIARKGDLRLIDADGTTTLAQGQETTRDESSEKQKRKRDRGGAIPAAGGGILDSPYAIGAGIAVVGGVAAWALLHDDEPFSPKRP
jgi:hypothetical protein